MNLAELKTAAAQLTAADRLALNDWLLADEGVLKANFERLKQDIQVGIDQLDRGEFITYEGEEGLKALFDGVRERVKARLGNQRRSAA